MTPEDLKANYRYALTTAEGLTILEDLQKRFHINTPTFSEDPYETAYREGQRTVVLFIENMMREQIEPTEV